MTVRVEPENNETKALLGMADFRGRRVLEIGCGDGRLTRRYARKAAGVVAIDAFGPAILRARRALPKTLHGRVVFRRIAFEDFAARSRSSTFDIALLSWSL